MKIPETSNIFSQKKENPCKVFYELLIFAIENDEENEFYTEHEKDELKEMYKEILEIN